MMDRITLEHAEAKLISSLANLVWIIPCLVVIEYLMVYFIFDNFNTWNGSGTISVLTTVLWVIVIFKVINVIDRQINAERERQIQKEKTLKQKTR
ncbi:MAG: hypothetical protein ACXAC7_11450 [Candidatus Hodarchaeales archaeon]|jgi:uncharacterized membrane protein